MATGGGLNRTRVSVVRSAKLTRRERKELRKRPPPPREPVVLKARKPTRRERGKRRGRIKRFFGLTRRECGAIGASHIYGPEGYRTALVTVGLKAPQWRRG